jgi:pyruvate,orthophosphate dikinase
MSERVLGELIAVSDLISIGAMISSARACQIVDAIASKASFLQLNLEDLTSSAFATSKKDAEKFLPLYCKDAVFQSNPFKVIDVQGVGQMLQTALKQSQLSLNPDIECSIAEGEQTGDPR